METINTESLNTVKLKWTLSCKEVYPAFALDKENANVVKLLQLYLARDERFETKMPERNYALGKGLLLHGKPGTGKTILLRIIHRTLYYLHSGLQFKRYNMRELCQNYQTFGASVLQPERRHWLVDEFGLTDREPVQSYGNRIIVGDELIGIRYDLFQQGGYLLHLSTNLTAEQMADFYNERTMSRLFEMCNFIPLDGSDRRLTAKPKPMPQAEKPPVDRKKISIAWWQMVLREFLAYKAGADIEIKGSLQQFRIFEDAGLLVMSAAEKQKFIRKAQQQIKKTKLPFNRTGATALKALIAGIENNSLTGVQDAQLKSLAATLAIKNFYDGKSEREYEEMVGAVISKL